MQMHVIRKQIKSVTSDEKGSFCLKLMTHVYAVKLKSEPS